MIPGDSWFPVTGNIILKGNHPICSVPDDRMCHEIMEALTNHNKGITYTCISAQGWYCKEVAKESGEPNAN